MHLPSVISSPYITSTVQYCTLWSWDYIRRMLHITFFFLAVYPLERAAYTLGIDSTFTLTYLLYINQFNNINGKMMLKIYHKLILALKEIL